MTSDRDPIDRSFFVEDQNEKSVYKNLLATQTMLEYELYGYEYIPMRECMDTLVTPLRELVAEVQARQAALFPPPEDPPHDAMEGLTGDQDHTEHSRAPSTDSNVTQAPPVEPRSQLNPDLLHYLYNPDDQEITTEFSYGSESPISCGGVAAEGTQP